MASSFMPVDSAAVTRVYAGPHGSRTARGIDANPDRPQRKQERRLAQGAGY
jgi:hypothetical protein